jgi:ketosteroid isomerase-like protein
MSQENIDLIRVAYAHFARRDLPAVFKLFAEDIEFYQSQELRSGPSPPAPLPLRRERGAH